MLSSSRFPYLASLAILVGIFPSPAWTIEAAKWFPADTDVILTFNVRAFLSDHADTEFVQRYLEQWRLAIRGDQELLRKYYHAQRLRKSEGVSEVDFLDRARRIKALSDSFGMDPLKDLDRITIAFTLRDAGLVAIIIEGRFQEEKVKRAIKQLTQHHFLALLNPNALAITWSKKHLQALLARAGGPKDTGLPVGLRNLLDSLHKEHVAVALNRVDRLGGDAAIFLKDQVARSMGGRDRLGEFIAAQAAEWIKKYAQDVSAIGIGLSPRDDELKLQVGLDAKKEETARDLHILFDRGNFWAALTLKAIGSGWTRQLADVLLRERVKVKGTALVIQGEVPYAFITDLAKGHPWLALLSAEQASAQARTSSRPAQFFLDDVIGRLTAIPLWGLPSPPGQKAAVFKEELAIVYRKRAGVDAFRNRLDLFLPRNKKDFPVVVLVHGGNWIIGDNRSAGLYSSVGQFLATQGIGAVLPNYRLWPAVKHPDQVQDVARAVAWTRDNIARYGGDPRRIYLMGHSAGGHLVALLATDETYFRAEGVRATDIKGVIAISGVYRIPTGDFEIALGGSGPRAVRLHQVIPLRGESSPFVAFPFPGVPVRLNLFAPIFGATEKECADASPLTHVRRGLPPFLILSAEHDFPTLAPMADEFHEALRNHGCDVQLLKMAKRNHNSLLFSAITVDDPAAAAILEFIKK